MFHIAEQSSCGIKVLGHILRNKFGEKINFITHKLPDEFYTREKFEEQIEHYCHKQIYHIMTKESVYQKEDSIISITHGIKKFDSGYGMIFNIMFYYNKNFYNQESEPMLIPEKYKNLVNESQSDSSKLFLDNFISEPEVLEEFCKKEFDVEISKLISCTFSQLLDKI